MKKYVASNPISKLIASLSIDSKEGTIIRAAPIAVTHGIKSLISLIRYSSHALPDIARFISRLERGGVDSAIFLLSDLSSL